MAMPPFHIIGLMSQSFIPLYSGTSIVLWDLTAEGATVPTPTPDNTIRALSSFHCDSTIIVPSFIVQWAQDWEATEFLKTMDYLVRPGHFNLSLGCLTQSSSALWRGAARR